MKLFAGNGGATLTGGAAPAVAVAAKRAWDAVTAPARAYLQRQAVYRELTELDDRMLSDIGLSRADVHAAVSGLRPADGGRFDPGA